MINDLIQLFGIANPQLSIAWTLQGKTTPATALTASGTMRLACGGGLEEWVAPIAGVLNVNAGLEKILLPNGTVPTAGIVLHVDPQTQLRLARLLATVVEGQAANTDQPERPVPAYFVYTNTTGLQWMDNGTSKTGPDGGLVFPGDPLHIQGDLTIHDQHGFSIDPVAAACWFEALLAAHVTLESKAINKNPGALTANRQLATIAAMGNNETLLQLHNLNGTVFNPPSLPFQNINGVDAGSGLYTIGTPGNPIIKNSGVASDIKIGAATYGALADTYKIRAVKNALKRDFLRAYAVDLSQSLLGITDPAEPSVQNNLAPVYRDGETINFCANGNECLGQVNAVLTGAPALSLAVSPVIDSDFTLPPQPTTAGAHLWPTFPAAGGAGSTGPVPVNIKQNITFHAAHFITDAATGNADVYVEIFCPQFVNGDSVRVYNRVFDMDDASETRGDGKGAIIAANTVALRLTDPFELVKPFTAPVIPAGPTLSLDLVLVNRGLQRRSIGNLFTTVGAPAPLLPNEQTALAQGANNLNAVAERGISPAGILGMQAAIPLPGAVNFGQFILNVLNENQPRQSGRLPTMARKDSMAAAFNANWQAFLGGTVFKKDGLNNYPLFGNPGNPGGREWTSAGIQTANGWLAYDIARAAYRRTRNVLERAAAFIAGNGWAYTPPAPPATSTFAAATLQTVAAACETPEVAAVMKDMTDFPKDFATFLSVVQSAILPGGTLPSWVPAALANRFKTAMANLGNDPNGNMAYNELKREVCTSIYGRRDTYWALRNAIQNANECIYIQGTLFGQTAYGAPADDLLQLIKTAVAANKRLKVIVCLGKEINFGKGYEPWEARFYAKRKAAVDELMGPVSGSPPHPANASQVIAFHPKGFPMRPKELIHQVVIVDDVWALTGSSSFSRRGLSFDGSQDLSVIDKNIVGGKGAGIKNFRIRLMQEHLNILPATGLPAAETVRLGNLHESFWVFKELLEGGGAGLIEPIWTGNRTDIDPQFYPSDDLADPDNKTFSSTNALLIQALQALGTTPA
ncbi:MAG: hypothetical protein INR73_01550 [Williamsia sp.]|nr:hypothetical protein [Williamsia sp.]